ncbi:hypothetical protein DL766_008483 [Monosporascus sp. MC13-8B]|nr:hypothetical protein DL766_008483 [Monosporascus sp. MC13-8B]
MDASQTKPDNAGVEHAPHDGEQSGAAGIASKNDERTLDILSDQRVTLTEEDNRRIRRQTDKVILSILVWVYFLQILDKTVLGYGATFGLQESAHLTGNQYSFLGSIAPIGQLAVQPFSSYLIVRVPPRVLMPALCLGWGIAQTAMAACRTYSQLLAARFLGLFEGGCLPLFGVITSYWFRRAEQPMRVAAWYSTNGLATVAASALSYGLGHIPSERLESWQIIFLFVGLVTIVTVPFVYWKLDNDILTARFLSENDKPKAVERLRANQTGTTGSNHRFKWRQVLEMAAEPKTYLWVALSVFLNAGAAVTNTFGPLILNGLDFDPYTTSLLNMPFGLVQFSIILAASWLTRRLRLKSAVLFVLTLPVVAGLAVLYAVPRSPAHNGPLLAGYYLLAFLFGGTPAIVAWIIANTAGATKKSAIMSVYNAAASTGNIIGPLVFDSRDAPEYLPGLRAMLGVFVALAACTALQAGNLALLNRRQERRRVRNGKPAKIRDASMTDEYQGFCAHGPPSSDTIDNDNDNYNVSASVVAGSDEVAAMARDDDAELNLERRRLGDNAFSDMTDRENDEFIYVL